MEYIVNKKWSEVNQERKYFCAELFYEIRKNPLPFWEVCGLSQEYDIAYQVRFFREFIQELKNSCFQSFDIPVKRIFDLALLSRNELVIIETSTKKNFSCKKLDAISADVKYIQRVCAYTGISRPSVIHLAVCSSKYRSTDDSLKCFNKIITWADLKAVYPEKESVFNRADESYISPLQRSYKRCSKFISEKIDVETMESEQNENE